MNSYLVSPDLDAEIKSKVDRLTHLAVYHLKKHSTRRHALERMGDLYSWWIENPELRRDLLRSKREDKLKIKKLAKIGEQRIKDAWQNLSRYDFTQNIPLDAIIETAHTVEPANTNSRYYPFRQGSGGAQFSIPPTNPLSARRDLTRALDVVNYAGLSSLEGAIYLHLNIARIQPFNDGNKRTARLLQRKKLYDHGYFSVPLKPGERLFYIEVIDAAMRGQADSDHMILDAYKEHDAGKIDEDEYRHKLQTSVRKVKGRDLENVRNFYDFCASKVNIACDELLRDLHIERK